MAAVLRTIAYTGVLFVAAGYAWFTLTGPHGVQALREKRESITTLQQENSLLRQEIDRRRDRILKLKDNRDEQDLEIRRRLKLIRPGETYLLLPPGQQTEPDPSKNPADNARE